VKIRSYMLRMGLQRQRQEQSEQVLGPVGLVAEHTKVGSMLYLRSRFGGHEFGHLLHRRRSFVPVKC
jgi:hypothetical protein